MREPVTLLVDRYLAARQAVIAAGFESELQWQRDIRLENVRETDFLREVGWVILSSGMRATVIGKVFPRVSAAFLDWRSASLIVSRADTCEQEALKVFSHARKIRSILSIAAKVEGSGYFVFRQRLAAAGIEFLRTLPFMGPATACHLAKNIGIDVVKPDRHLLRLAEVLSYAGPTELCGAIASETGDRLAVVDLVLWRFATLFPAYLRFFGRRAGLQDEGVESLMPTHVTLTQI